MKNLIYFSALLLSLTAQAGTSHIQIQCKSASGKTSFDATFGGDENTAVINLSLTDKTNPKKKIATTYVNALVISNLLYSKEDPMQRYPGHQLVTVSTVDRLDLGIYTIDAISRDAQWEQTTLRLIAKPATIRYKNGKYGSREGSFQAILSGIDPRIETQTDLDPIDVSCTYLDSV